MPPKRGKKRKASRASTAAASNGTANNKALAPLDRAAWGGWVDMESEPAYFNVMLKEMGVCAAKVQEIYSMDEDILAILPRPVYAIIFLFRYHAEDEESVDSPPDTRHIWFANQIPEFACASVALLNIINNIPGLLMGKELRDFKEFTRDMEPTRRGDMINEFDFVRRIHNSFSRDNDIRQVDMDLKEKYDKHKKRAVTAKAKATREAKKVAIATEFQQTSKATDKPATTAPARVKKATRVVDPTGGDTRSTPLGKSRRLTKLPAAASDPHSASEAERKTGPKAAAKANSTEVAEQVQNDGKQGLRRSTRTPKPRKNLTAVQSDCEVLQDGFHFIAYMPIGNHVWKLDGLDPHPIDMGSFDTIDAGTDGGTGDWINTILPILKARFEQYSSNELEFNLMALLQDPAVREFDELVQNINSIQAVETKLTATAKDWHEMQGGETGKDVLTGGSTDFAITQEDIDKSELPTNVSMKVSEEENILELLSLRQKLIAPQAQLRCQLRDALASSKEDDEKARNARHNYSTFVRSWLGVLAEYEVLEDLIT